MSNGVIDMREISESFRQNVIFIVFAGAQLELEANQIYMAFDDDIDPQSNWLFQKSQYSLKSTRSLVHDKIDMIVMFMNKSEMFDVRMQRTIDVVLQKDHVFIECYLEDGSERPIDWPSIELLSKVIIAPYPTDFFHRRPKKKIPNLGGTILDGVCSKNPRNFDPLYQQARALVLKYRRPSISLIQRHLAINDARGRSLLEAMVGDILGPMDMKGNYEILD